MSDKFRVTYDPPFGSKCLSCGMGGDGEREFLEWGVVEEFWGSLVLCKPCALEAMGVLALAPVAVVTALEEQVRSVSAELEKVQEKNVELNNTLDRLLGVRPDLIDRTSGDSVSPESATEPDNSGPQDEQFGFDEPLTGGGFEELSESQSADRVSPNLFSS